MSPKTKMEYLESIYLRYKRAKRKDKDIDRTVMQRI